MNPNIRNYIINNFKNTETEDIKNSIEESIKKGDEITLPGLGVFFELLWNNSSKEEQDKILITLKNNLVS
ncbi:MAG: small acid-soluble spore protein SspI [Bacilli bacterium]|nr:small acid-soluble spore protein SspI [Bacilli bacterium]